MTPTRICLVALCLACGPPGEDGDPLAVRGVVHYEGSVLGPLDVAVFATFPPRGAPFARTRFEEPAFPQPWEIRDVPPGRWFVLAIVDADPADGDRYHPEIDAGGAFGRLDAPAPVAVDLWGAQGVDLDLVDPAR